MEIHATFIPAAAQAAVNGRVGRPAPDGYISVRVGFGRRIYVHGVGDYPRRTYAYRPDWDYILTCDSAKAVARHYLAGLGIPVEEQSLIATSIRAGDTSAWIVVAQVAE
jgi:hypothetical protein